MKAEQKGRQMEAPTESMTELYSGVARDLMELNLDLKMEYLKGLSMVVMKVRKTD